MTAFLQVWAVLLLASLFVIHVYSATATSTAAAAAAPASTAASRTIRAPELPAANLTSHLRYWQSDLAVMFYAPWCKYCKQLKPSWDQISTITAPPATQNLNIYIFNCEEPARNVEICADLGVDRYPSVYFLGYGNFNQAPRGNPLQSLFSPPENPRIARFVADLYPEAIYEWIRMLAGLSHMQRRWADFTGFFTGRNHMSDAISYLQADKAALESKVALFGVELEKYKADALFDSLADSGDVFPQLNALNREGDAVGPENLSLRTCVGEMVSEYCKYHGKDRRDAAYCSIIADCVALAMEPLECRPAKCPLDARGCRVASVCQQDDIIAAYDKSTTAKGAAGSGSGMGGTARSGGRTGSPGVKV